MNLRQGRTRSCGCRERQTHGLVGTPEYRVWQNMIQRCYNPKHPAYARYGGREIEVCKHWREDPAAFVGDIGPRPSDEHQIDRTDRDGHYEPGNVHWVAPRRRRLGS